MQEIMKDTKRKIDRSNMNHLHRLQSHPYSDIELIDITEEHSNIPVLSKKVRETDHPPRNEWEPQKRYNLYLRGKILRTFDKPPEQLSNYELKYTKLGQRWVNRHVPIIINAK